VWHATSQGDTTKHGLTRAIFEELGLDPARVTPTTSAAFPLPAPRPAYSVLGHDAWRMTRIAMLPPWRESLAQALPDVVGKRSTKA
jgi:dTDP-4-dehydrorhamnose reductase